MSASLLDGRALSKRRNRALKDKIARLPRPPGLAVVLVGEDPASQVYVRRKGVVADRIGMHHVQVDLPPDVDLATLLQVIDELNEAPDVDGILVQLPLPGHLDESVVTDRIAPEKDADGLHPINLGKLGQGRPLLVACTPQGVMELLEDSGVDLVSKHAVVLGRSNIVGRPMAMLLEQAHCTVTVCHSRTRDLEARIRGAEVLVVAVGRPGFVPGEWVREGAVVVDVGINRLEDGRLVGDVDYDGAQARASAITPVPGGVGPMTIAMLMANTYLASCLRQGCAPE